MNIINIGLHIEQRINQLNISKAEFGRRINTPAQNVTRILKKEHCDTNELIKYGEALDFNFFTLFCEKEITEAKQINYATNVDTINYNEHSSDADITIAELKRQLSEEKEKSAKYWSVIENLTKR